MKNSFFMKVLSVVAVSLAIHFCSVAAPTVLNSYKAVVNGEVITQVDLDEAVKAQVHMYLMKNKGMVSTAQAARDIKKIEDSALNDLIDRKLILSEFKTMGGKIGDKYVDEAVERFIQGRYKGDRNKFMDQLAEQGLSLNQFREIQRDQIAIQALQAKHSQRSTGIELSLPEERKAIYEEIKGEYASKGQPELRMLSIPKITQGKTISEQKAHAESIRSQIRNGASFSSMAKKYSQDSFASKGGYVGVVGKNQLNQHLTQVAYSLSADRVSEVIDDGPSYRLMYVDRYVGKKVPSQKDLADEIEKRLMIRKRQQNMDGWLKKLRRDANVRIFN